MSTSLSSKEQSVQVKNNFTDVNEVMEKVLIAGDLSKMEPKDRITYYLKTCESLGMNPMTKPFDLITLNGKMVLYPNRSGTDQLRKIGNVDTTIVSDGFDKDTGCYVVRMRAELPSGRKDEDMGIVYCAGLKGDSLANAQLKAMTKAKRRVTLSIMGLGWIDESEVSSVKNAKTHKMDLETGAVIDTEIVGAQQSGPVSVVKPNVPPTQEHLKLLFELSKARGLTLNELKDALKKEYGITSTKDLSMQQYNAVCDWLKYAVPDEVATVKKIADQELGPIDPFGEESFDAQKEQMGYMK